MEFHAQRARDWWGLWNRGCPIAKLHAHFPQIEGKHKRYLMIFDSFNKDWKFNSSKEVQLCFLRFILEMEAYWTNELLDGYFGITLTYPGLSQHHQMALPRLCIIPVKSENEGHLLGQKVSIVKAAWDLLCDYCELPPIPENLVQTKNMHPLISWLLQTFGALSIPLHDKSKAGEMKGNLHFMNVKGCNRYCLGRIGSGWGGVIVLQGTSDTNLILKFTQPWNFYDMVDIGLGNGGDGMEGISLEEIDDFPPLPFLSKKERKRIRSSDKITNWNALDHTWMSLVSNLNNNHNSRVEANFTYAFVSELLESYNASIPVILKEKNRKNATYKLDMEKIHPSWGELQYRNAVEFADLAFEDNDGGIALNQVFDPFTWSKKHLHKLSQNQNNEPHTIQVEKISGVSDNHWPKVAFMKISSNGDRTLAKRKKSLLQRASTLFNIRQRFSKNNAWLNHHEAFTRNLEFGSDWRLNSSGPFQLIQGPPGTGKTWTSTRLVEDILEANPAARILVCSKEHLALDHLTESIQEALSNSVNKPVVRISSSSNLNRETDAYIRPKWHEQAEMYWDSILQNVVDPNELNKIIHGNGGMKKPWSYAAYIDEANVICTTSTDLYLLDNLRKEKPAIFDYCIVEEAGKSYLSELIGALALSRNWILVGDHMQLPPYQIVQSRANYRKCIEFTLKWWGMPKKDKPRDLGFGETQLARLTQTHMWGAIPDKKIEAYIDDYMNESFEPFKDAYNFLKERNGTHFLPEQRRMFRILSDLIANIFYDTTFDWKKENETPDSELPNFFKNHGRLIFIDTPHASVEKKWKEAIDNRRSRKNEAEAELVLEVIHSIGPGHKIVVLTPYNGQVNILRRLISEHYPLIEVQSTDGFQGKEADFIILSLVRNNILTGRSRWGFVTDPHRLNVALSRAREGLVIVSSQQQITESKFDEGDNHLQQVLEYIQNNGTIIDQNKLGGL